MVAIKDKTEEKQLLTPSYHRGGAEGCYTFQRRTFLQGASKPQRRRIGSHDYEHKGPAQAFLCEVA